MSDSAPTTSCQRGHERNEKNTYVDKVGKRKCRPCRSQRYKKVGTSWRNRQKGFSDCDPFPPACACGCLEPVPQAFDGGRPGHPDVHGVSWRAYVDKGHQAWDESEKARRRQARRHPDGIPAQEFGQTLKALKEKNGWTWVEMGALTGRRYTSLYQYLRFPGRTVSQEVASDILARLAGQAKLATKRQAKEYTETRTKMSKDDRAETMRENNLNERRAKVDALRERMGHGKDE